MFVNKPSILVIIIFSILMTSCASIMNESLAEIAIDSYPNDAIIKINGQIAGKTPTVLKLKRGDIYIIEIQKDGYKNYKVITTKPTTDWVWGNFFFGGLYGLFLDYENGNAYDIEPKEINAKLEKEIGFLQNYNLNSNISYKYVTGEFETINLKDVNNNLVGKVNITWE